VRTHLLPRTFLLTPNIPEAEVLTGLTIRSLAEMEEAGRRLQGMGARHVLVKGGHREGDATDLLISGDTVLRLPGERIETSSTHGTGCSYAAALATLMAQGEELSRRRSAPSASSTPPSATLSRSATVTGRSITGVGQRR